MTKRLILKSFLLLLIANVVYLKVNNPNPDWLFEISTDMIIVFIALGMAEIIIRFFYSWFSSFFPILKK